MQAASWALAEHGVCCTVLMAGQSKAQRSFTLVILGDGTALQHSTDWRFSVLLCRKAVLFPSFSQIKCILSFERVLFP